MPEFCSCRAVVIALVVTLMPAHLSAQSLTGLRIEGPDTVAEGSSAFYNVIAEFDGGLLEFDVTLSNCFNGALNPPAATCLNPDADLDNNGDVDPFDFLTFSNCFNGALNPPGCMP